MDRQQSAVLEIANKSNIIMKESDLFSRTELLIGLTLIIEKNRNALSVSEIEILTKTVQVLEEGRVGVFKKYILPILIRLLICLPTFLLELDKLL
jgi:hypothetical protein